MTEADSVSAAEEAGGRGGLSLGGLVAAAGWLALLSGAVTLVVGGVWPVLLATNFHPQMALAVLVSAAGSLLTGERRQAGVLGAGGVILLVLMVSRGPALMGPPSGDAHLQVLFANVNRENQDRAALIRTIQAESPDVIGLSEVDTAWITALGEVADLYPHTVFEPRADNFGIALLSRLPLAAGDVETLGPGGLPSIRAEVTVEGQPVTIWVTHPIPPVNEYAVGVRDGQLLELAERVARAEDPVIIVGDLNDSPWSPSFRRFARSGGMESAARGLRSLYTWPVGLFPLFVQLDHCLYAGDLAERGFAVLGDIGSDHYPITCSFGLEP